MGRYEIAGKVAVVTGAGRGIGADVTRRLAMRGARVALLGQTKETLDAVADSCGSGARSWQVDVADWPAVSETIADVVGHFGQIDIVVANAGVARIGFLRAMAQAEFEHSIRVNLIGTWHTVRACLPHLIDRRGYCLVVASFGPFVIPPMNSAYVAAKAGSEAFSRVLRMEVRHLGVDVGIAYFSWVDTDMLAVVDEDPATGWLRARAPWPFRRVVSVADAGAAVTAGVHRRARSIFVPAWGRLFQLTRGWSPPLTELVLRRSIRKADSLVPERQYEQSAVHQPSAGTA